MCIWRYCSVVCHTLLARYMSWIVKTCCYTSTWSAHSHPSYFEAHSQQIHINFWETKEKDALVRKNIKLLSFLVHDMLTTRWHQCSVNKPSKHKTIISLLLQCGLKLCVQVFRGSSRYIEQDMCNYLNITHTNMYIFLVQVYAIIMIKFL